ncbi:hypothetical protein M0804_008436 [Polistes exclamans]|nr:hypothetical protein M0804_008436 [Polistes exclamans]
MAIMQSCCCWQSVRRGSYACAIYTGIYFTLLAIITGTILQSESEYLSGNRLLPESSSILELGTISPATLRFNITLLICSCSGIICSILLVYGLIKDKRIFLLPWIVNMISCSTVDISHVLYLILITVYSLLCVISQYQEYLADRGTAADDNNYRVSILKVSQRKGQRDKGGKVKCTNIHFSSAFLNSFYARFIYIFENEFIFIPYVFLTFQFC